MSKLTITAYKSATRNKLVELLGRANISEYLTNRSIANITTDLEIEDGYEKNKSVEEVSFSIAYEIIADEYRALTITD